MAGKYKVFDVKPRVVAEIESPKDVGFNLLDIDFECLPEQPALARLLWSGHWPDGEPATVIDVICSVLKPQDEARFMALLRRKDVVFDHGDLWPIANDLLEQYTARPTGSPASSANGRRERSASSEASSPKPESTGDGSPSGNT